MALPKFELPQFELPIWFNKGELLKLSQAIYKFYSKVCAWITYPLIQLDPLECSEQALELLAWQRDISRFKDEPLALYRKRVHYAYINAKDAGSVAGFKRIFMRLGIGYVEIAERQEGLDWDVITLHLTDGQLADNAELLKTIIQHYGRTCRRYGYLIITPIGIEIQMAEFSNDSVTAYISMDEGE